MWQQLENAVPINGKQSFGSAVPSQSQTFETKAMAQAWAGELESQMVRGVFISLGEAESTTLARALERYWTEVGSKKRHPSQERQRINHWLKNLCHSDPLAICVGMTSHCTATDDAPMGAPRTQSGSSWP